jgi:hypothetical protein
MEGPPGLLLGPSSRLASHPQESGVSSTVLAVGMTIPRTAPPRRQIPGRRPSTWLLARS